METPRVAEQYAAPDKKISSIKWKLPSCNYNNFTTLNFAQICDGSLFKIAQMRKKVYSDEL